MSIEDLCSQDSVTVLLEGVTVDGLGGVVEDPVATVGTLNCLVQANGGRGFSGASQVLDYQARNQKTDWILFFAENPNLTGRNRLNWSGRIIRVLDSYPEGRPGENELLWVVEGEEHRSRPESLA